MSAEPGRGPDAPARLLAQLNVAEALYEFDDPRLSDFLKAVALVNGAADRSPGFVWRLPDPSGRMNAGPEPRTIVNLSVWRTLADLRSYLERSVHRVVRARRAAWFAPPAAPHAVMWWIAPEHRPSLEEGLARLARLRREGAGPDAFDFAYALRR